ncbi:hypothetical protein [Devosia sp. 919]|uniref:hypothetical protein n=1 Tax=Devosia sp. 919 TaxID=2726065 RepID=UPI0015525998|nr:hypothetical protein [Devosia sp. 919]
MEGLTTEIVKRIAADTIFGKPLVTNVYRSVIVEAIVATALPDWNWCSADYASCDFIHPDGTRLEVKQSAMRQTWVTKAPSKPSWDIAARTGFWENGTDWTERAGRNADVYVLGLHDLVDDNADHRDPAQWQFFVLSEHRLPSTKRLGLATAMRLVQPVGCSDLAGAVRKALSERRFVYGTGDLQRSSAW